MSETTTTTRGPVWRELQAKPGGGRRLTADMPGEVTLWVESYPRQTPRWTVDVARGFAWVARREDGGLTLATAKRRAMDLAMIRRVEAPS